MISNLSKKHHYLPRYYLKGFTNNEGGFYVYDKKEDNIFPTSPGNSFFENYLNTIELSSGKRSDFLEKIHSHLENDSWDSFDNIRYSNRSKPINLIDKSNLYLFRHFLHWRLPSNFEHLQIISEDILEENSEHNYFEIVDKDGNPASNDDIEKIGESINWEKISQTIVPLSPFFKGKNWINNIERWRFVYTGDSNSWYIVGDNPIVSQGAWDHDPMRCLEEFIFPVSGNMLLISLDREICDPLSPGFTVQFGIAIIERARRFVACHNKEFLNSLIDLHETYLSLCQQDNIISELFNMASRNE